MDGVSLFGGDGSSLVDGITDDVHDPAQGLRADGNTDGRSGVDHILAADESLGGIHSDGPHPRVSEMLSDLEDKSVLHSLNLKSVENGRNLPLKLHINDSTDDLHTSIRTCEICPFLEVTTLPVEKSRAPLIRVFINIIND